MTQYVVNYSDEDKLIEVPDGAELELSSVAAGDGHITVLLVKKDNRTLAAFVGAMRYYPVDMEPQKRTWARG